MGVISRKIFPACESMCVCCPALRSRSRQPVKRYKKLLAEIFPKSPDGPANDRKIAKLCEYAARNPIRLPEIAKYLEKRCFKELRNGHIKFVRIIAETYNKLLCTCGDHIVYFAINLLNVILELLDDSKGDDILIIGCQMLTAFIYSQVDGIFAHNIEILVEKVCLLAGKNGVGLQKHKLQAASLQSLSAMIWFMDEFAHMFIDFDKIVHVVLENFETETQNGEDTGRLDAHHNWVDEVSRCADRVTPVAGSDFSLCHINVRSRPEKKDPSMLTREEVENPNVWAQICIQKFVDLAKESTTMRQVLDPMFVYFDAGNHWVPHHGLAPNLLSDISYLIENPANQQTLLAGVVRHLDHKSVVHDPLIKSHVIQTATCLAHQIRAEFVISDMGLVSDLCKHLRKCCQAIVESVGEEELNLNATLQLFIENCLWETIKGIVDVRPLFDIMAIALEKLPPVKAVAHAALASLIILAHVISLASPPFHLQYQKVFPDALLVQLLKVMQHSDAEIRVGGHQIFCILLIPSFSLARNGFINNPKRWHSKCASTFASVTARLERLRIEKLGSKLKQGSEKDDFQQYEKVEDDCKHGLSGKNSPNIHVMNSIFDRTSGSPRLVESEQSFLQCNEDQIAQLLSALWIQLNRPDNLPANVEAIAHSFCLVFLASHMKNSSNSIALRFFQLPISLRKLALGSNSGDMSPAYQRLLFVLSTALLMFAAKLYHITDAHNLHDILLESDVDPYVGITDEFQVYLKPHAEEREYGSNSDNNEASLILAKLREKACESDKFMLGVLADSLSSITKFDAADVADQISEEFVPDETFMFGNQSLLEMEYFQRAGHSKGSPSYDGEFSAHSFADDDAVSVSSVGHTSRVSPKLPASSAPSMPHIVSIGKLLESALEVAGQVAGTSVSTSPLPYSTMTNQCEAFGIDTRKKLNWLTHDTQFAKLSNTLLPSFPSNHLSPFEKPPGGEPVGGALPPANPWLALRLPPASPFDNFLRAARG